MADWDPNWTAEALTQDVPGAIHTLNPGEGAHIQFVRTGVVTDLMLIGIYTVLTNDVGERDLTPLYSFGLEDGDDPIPCILRGIWGWVAIITNGEDSPSGSVSAIQRFKKDGVHIDA